MSVREKILAAEARWVMGRVMAGDFLDGVDKYLHLVAPEREKELSAAIRARAGELAEADKNMIVDQPSEGALGIGAAVLASFETRPYEIAFKTLSERNNPPDKIEQRFAAQQESG